MTGAIRKYVRTSAIVLGFIILFLIVVTLVVNFAFRDQLIKYVIAQLNEQVNTQITISKVDFSLWKKFPNASVQFKKVLVQSSNTYRNRCNQKDTLLLADQIFLEFNLLKLIKGNYELRKLHIKDGHLKFVRCQEGIENYNILKQSGNPSDKQFRLELKNFEFENVLLEYRNVPSSVEIISMADKLKIYGDFASSVHLNVDASMQMKLFSVNNKKYVLNKPVRLKADLSLKDSMFMIQNGRISVKKLAFLTEGQFSGGNNRTINLNVRGDKLKLSQLIEILPDDLKMKLSDFTGKGNVDMKINIAGPVSQKINPDVKVMFALSDGLVIQKATDIKLKQINLHGSYTITSGKYDEIAILKIDNIRAVLGSGNFSGKGSIEDFHKPTIKLNVSYSLNLSDLKKFMNADTLEILSGNINGNFISSATLPGLSSIKLSHFSNVKCTGYTNLQDVSIKLKGSDYYFEHMNGNISLDNDFYFRNISLKIHDNDFFVNGSLTDAIPYFFKQRSDVTLQADVTSDHLDLSNYFVSKENEKGKTEYSRELLFPDNINLDVKVKIKQFKLNKFNAKNVSGYVNYKPKIFVLKSLSFESLNGRISGNGLILQDLYKNFVLKCQADISKVNIQQMFYVFDNFSQDILQDKHLRGYVSGQIGFSSEWNNVLTLNKDKLIVDADLTIYNGQLVNFEPMSGLSKFISLEELKDIKFSTLKNHILIKDKQIIIPRMDIESSAFSINASGVHLFDNHYDYKVKIRLSDVLWRKSKKSKQRDEEFGELEDDGLGRTSIPLSITGYNNDYKIKYDPKLMLSDVKESFKKQKSELKTICKEEFGWFKKDTSVNVAKPVKKSKVKIVWDEADQDKASVERSSEKKSSVTKTKSTEEKPKIEWE